MKGRFYVTTPKGLIEHLGNGKCYMHNGGNECNGPDYSFVEGECYCPDYYNRKRGNREQKKTLEEWIYEGLIK